MISIGYALANIGAPVQWLLFAAVAGAMLAPRFIPPVARVLGRGLGRWNRRKRLRPAQTAALPSARAAVPEPTDAGPKVWVIWLIVGLSAAVLSWFLLRSR